ncbi:SET domain-containing protein SmydA-8-like isoform X1 [Sitophilus oryzae]|uniref:SET domain-containing protein SmydA-8-like isoform X1 n=1 Tax=Sitophilus oryzae TaxID=7048 RepID=A0A6J2XKA8_SITOR|nr:SET domain-containing protein SmydA-8-like isoform X1 [Sitophilus oryzae]
MSNKTYKVVRNSVLGRYMVASKNLKQGQLIFKENPLFLGPQLNGPARCFKCLKIIVLSRCCYCSGCDTALMCTNQCEGKYHSKIECATLKSLNIKGQIIMENSPLIFPLRCLLLRKYDVETYKRLLDLEPHLEARRDTAIWRRHRIAVENVMQEMNLLSEDDIKDELIQKICGILDINTFEVRPPMSQSISILKPETQCLRGLYLEAAMMAHDCIPNAHLSVDDNFVMSVYASIDINENEPIYFNYSNILQGNQERQQHLLEGKYFSCRCRRCRDPTELGTEISSIVCHKCRKGLLRMKEIEKDFRIWQCNECQVVFKSFLIELAINEARRRISDIDLSDLHEMENLHNNLVMTFHPNHYLMLELKQHMVALYAKLPPTKNNLTKKIDLCGRLLSVYTKLEPGISRIRALTMYELQSAIIDLSNKEYRDKELSESGLLSELQRAEKILKECAKYLLYEPSKSPEGRMALVALKELKYLRESIENIQKDVLINGQNERKDKKLKMTKAHEENSLNHKEKNGRIDDIENTSQKIVNSHVEYLEKNKNKPKKKNKKAEKI